MKKVELLAPAGGYETMVGAFNAGADAVYLGGSKFGARAYADNFDKEQVLDAISYAHLFGKKIYMTVNTLVKEREYGELYDFLLPFAEKRLDGVIVQDLGVMKLIRDEFPEIELHASTQAAVTGVYGARLLKSLGCSRIVPARELSLAEMSAIRKEADIEVEAFIHGAMCYCYSGMCLFSSMVGGRSGNRGRCAQPCRLPYYLSGKKAKEQYPLSLKDMCTVQIIGELIDAGIDSFKIEGRMKRPEYAAGVTAIYRKYIDLYYEQPQKIHEVSDEDMEILKSLYLRSEISEGYYHRHNGRDMITLSSPSYNGTSDKVIEEVKEKYLSGRAKIKCDMKCRLVLGENAYLSMSGYHNGEKLIAEVYGSKVQKASKRPMDGESVLKHLSKVGDTPFELDDITIEINDNGAGTGIFIPVSELNDLRRQLCERVLESIESKYLHERDRSTELSEKNVKEQVTEQMAPAALHALASTKGQFDAVLNAQKSGVHIKRIYIDSNIFLSNEEQIFDADSELFVALPYITRKENFDGTKDIEYIIENAEKREYSGVLVRNLEQLGILHEKNYGGKIVLDYGMYTWNMQAASMVKDLASEICAPLEETFYEAAEMAGKVRNRLNIPVSYNIYGFAPMMVSAGCVKKTLDKCSGEQNQLFSSKAELVDRLGNRLKATTDCRNCYNVIWNVHPTSLHKKLSGIIDRKCFDNLRIDFSVEDEKETELILKNYGAVISGEKVEASFDGMEYTTGHFGRGVE